MPPPHRVTFSLDQPLPGTTQSAETQAPLASFVELGVVTCADDMVAAGGAAMRDATAASTRRPRPRLPLQLDVTLGGPHVRQQVLAVLGRELLSGL